MNAPACAAVEVVDVRDVAALTTFSRSTVWRLVDAGKMPAPSISIGRKIRKWHKHVILDWLASNCPPVRT